ncbi:MAG TPA: hypothetical protein VIK14_16825 [Ignavibacteria bacterium]
MNHLNIRIPDLEPKEPFTIKIRPSVKFTLSDLSKKTKIPHEDIIRAGIYYVEKEFNRKLKSSQRNKNLPDTTINRKIINPFPKLVKRTKKEINYDL